MSTFVVLKVFNRSTHVLKELLSNCVHRYEKEDGILEGPVPPYPFMRDKTMLSSGKNRKLDKDDLMGRHSYQEIVAL